MHRRQALTALVSGISLPIAGCSRFRSLSEPATDERIVTLASVEDVTDDLEVSVSVDLLQHRIDETQPSRLRVTTTNQGPQRVVSVGPGRWCSPFNRWAGGSDDPPGLWLHHPAVSSDITRRGDRWTRYRPADEPRIFPDIGCQYGALDTGESVENEYVVWDDYRESGYFLPGTYEWREPVRVEGDASEDEQTFTWGFSLEVATQ